MAADDPVFFQSGWLYYDRYEQEQNRYMEDIHINVMRHLDTLINPGHNGDVLCIGDYDLRRKVGGYHLSDYLGWNLRVIPSPSDGQIPQSSITPVFDEMAAGTYNPRIVYVETPQSYLGYHLTTDQYLYLKTRMESRSTGLFLQTEAGGSTAWLSAFTDANLVHGVASNSTIYAAGGYSTDTFSNRTNRYMRMLVTDVVLGKVHLEALIGARASGVGGGAYPYSINGWGWFYPGAQNSIDYATFLEEYALLVSNELYTGLTGVPASSLVATGVLGIPAPPPPYTGGQVGLRRTFESK